MPGTHPTVNGQCSRSIAFNLLHLKQRAVLVYFNNIGIRKIAVFLGVTPSAVLYWIRQKHAVLQDVSSASLQIIQQ